MGAFDAREGIREGTLFVHIDDIIIRQGQRWKSRDRTDGAPAMLSHQGHGVLEAMLVF